jgi:uncharacterized protein
MRQWTLIGLTADEPKRQGMPILTAAIFDALSAARAAGAATLTCSLDLQRTEVEVAIGSTHWSHHGTAYPYGETYNDRTIYHWDGSEFLPISRFSRSLIKLVPTPWGAPTFEINGIKMLPSARLSPYADAEQKVKLIEPRGKTILDCCAGLGYFAACCLKSDAAAVHSYEKDPDVVWLRSLNPWSPGENARLRLEIADIALAIGTLTSQSYDAILHDPPRFGIAGELYSQVFYNELARLMRRKGRLFHYTGAPNKVARGRDLAAEVIARLHRAGFRAEKVLDGVLAVKS